jgi:hypothetical protein
MDLREQATYYCSHPPRCISGFVAEPVRLRNYEFDGHASAPSEPTPGSIIEGGQQLNCVFLLVCACGCEEHRIVGYWWRNPDFRNELVFLSPLTLKCNSCGKETELIDTDRHGYDAEIGGIVATARSKGERSEYSCSHCGPRGMNVIVRFEYPDDLFGAVRETFRGREQDLFTWFSLIGKCPGCTRLLAVTDFECA